MPITIVFWVLFVTVMCSLAIGLMAGHAIGYRKAEKVGRKRLSNLTKMYLNGTYGKKTKEAINLNDVNSLYPKEIEIE